MKIEATPLELVLSTPFRIAHGTSTTRNNVLVQIEQGVGIAAITPYYPAQVEDVMAYVAREDVQQALDAPVDHLEDTLANLPDGPTPARAAVDLALHDRWGQHLGQPLYRLWGLNPQRAPYSCFTLGMAEADEFRQKVIDVHQYPVLKIKLGTGSLEQDEALVRMAREHTEAQICVDANAAWSVPEAAEIIPRLAEYDLIFIEQPLAQHNIDGWHELAKLLPADRPPLIADESIHDARDILPLAGGADGINIKLAKSAERRWRRLNGHQQIIPLLEGKKFVNGELQQDAA